MNKQDLVSHWIIDLDNGKFLAPKHDPAGAATPYSGFRTVTVDQASGLKTFLDSGDYRLFQYTNTKYPKTPDYYEIVPNDPHKVTGSGIPGGSVTPTTACDRFAVVSGISQGNHVFAETL